MIWQDLLFDRWVGEAELRAATASAFGVPADAVAVVDNPEQLVATLPAARVVLERTRQHRDFSLQILVILRDDELTRRFEGCEGALRVATDLARQLDATVLFAEGPLAPSAWVRVRTAGKVDLVSLDVDETGDVDSFFVVAEHELPGDHPTSASPTSRMSA
jgi:hypothetical protein